MFKKTIQMKSITKKLLSKAKVRFCWWKGNVFDLSDLFKLLFLIALFLPILPWSDRKPISRNYSLYEPIRPLASFVERELMDVDSIRKRYEAEVSDPGLRDCLLKRDIVLTLAADHAVMMAEVKSMPWSNVPAVFIFEAVVDKFMDKISAPSLTYETVFLRTAKACQAYPNAYLSSNDIEPLKPLEVSNENISINDLFFRSIE